MDLGLLIVYDPKDGRRPFVLTRVNDRAALVQAARAALAESQSRAKAIAGHDEILATLERNEDKKLKRIFSFLLPELQSRGTVM